MFSKKFTIFMWFATTSCLSVLFYNYLQVSSVRLTSPGIELWNQGLYWSLCFYVTSFSLIFLMGIAVVIEVMLKIYKAASIASSRLFKDRQEGERDPVILYWMYGASQILFPVLYLCFLTVISVLPTVGIALGIFWLF